jgi:hypothetical protein
MDFFSADPDDLPEEASGIEITLKEEWFTAGEGLITVRALLAHLGNNDVLGADQDRIVADLKEFEQVLSEADKQGLQWHLEVDY